MKTSIIEIYDTTLRDGAQSEGIAFSAQDKLNIIRILDDLGVDYIEAGWPGANPKDVEVFELLRSIPMKNAQICAFGCTKRADCRPEDDKVLSELLAAQTPIVTIFGKSWDFQVTHALGVSLEENLAMIADSVRYLKAAGKRVFFDAEHFFDGYKANASYAIEALRAAHMAGAERIVLCDTNGGSLYHEIDQITSAVRLLLPDAVLGIHAHNDTDMAVANSIAAVAAGVYQVQGTINGYGERCGNANLCSVIANLELKLGYRVLGNRLSCLAQAAQHVSEIANKKLYGDAPFVGRSAFTHKGGVHASGVMKHSATYEHIEPELVGNTRRVLLSDQAGLASFKNKLAKLRLGATYQEGQLREALLCLKQREWEGYSFEAADASFELMLMEVSGQKPSYFELLGFRMISDSLHRGAGAVVAESSIKMRVANVELHTVSDGNGPVEALDRAIRKALADVYPLIDCFKLVDYKVRILDAKHATGAKTRVHITTSDGTQSWDTVGVSANIDEASFLALIDAICFGLMLKGVAPRC